MEIHYSPDEAHRGSVNTSVIDRAAAEVENRLPLLLTVPQVAGQLGIGRSSVYRLIDAGTLPTVAIGRARRITRAALLAYVERLSGGAE